MARSTFNLAKNIKAVIAIDLLQLSPRRMPVKTSNPCCTQQVNCMQGACHGNATIKINIKINI